VLTFRKPQFAGIVLGIALFGATDAYATGPETGALFDPSGNFFDLMVLLVGVLVLAAVRCYRKAAARS